MNIDFHCITTKIQSNITIHPNRVTIFASETNKNTSMRKHYSLLSILLAGTMMTSCHKEFRTENFVNDETPESTETIYSRTFAEPDKSKRLTGSPAENLRAIFESTGPGIITSMGRMNITSEQYQEISAFTTNLVKGKSSQTEKYREIFRWIVSNVKYQQSNNDPYAVFTNKQAVCQGYSNLLTVMCYTQGIPTVVVNGFLSTPSMWGGHAWAYTCTDGVWEVSDPTNTGSFPMKNTGNYTHLVPSEADVDLFTDDCAVYRYYDYKINVDRITTTENPLIVPYSAGGFVIESFNPTVDLPESITEIYMGQNITTFGESYNMSLLTRGKHLQAIYVDEQNPTLLGHKGVVYRKNGNEAQLYYIPGAMTFIELLPMEKVEKNTIYNHSSVEEIYFPEGTKKLESYAIENCPKLKRIYVPTTTEVASNAIYNCAADVEIVRGAPNGITNITMD